MINYGWGVDGLGRQFIVKKGCNKIIACVPSYLSALVFIYELEYQDKTPLTPTVKPL